MALSVNIGSTFGHSPGSEAPPGGGWCPFRERETNRQVGCRGRRFTGSIRPGLAGAGPHQKRRAHFQFPIQPNKPKPLATNLSPDDYGTRGLRRVSPFAYEFGLPWSVHARDSVTIIAPTRLASESSLDDTVVAAAMAGYASGEKVRCQDAESVSRYSPNRRCRHPPHYPVPGRLGSRVMPSLPVHHRPNSPM